MITSLESKIRAAYLHGGMDFLTGAPCDPKPALTVYSNLSDEEQNRIAQSWINGWHNESLMQSLPDGSPA